MEANPYILEMMILLLAIGGVGGFLSGLLGVGGGILFVPALVFCLSSVGIDKGHAMHLAVGSSLAIVFATGTASAISHYRRASVDLARLKSWGPYIVGGVLAGSLFASLVDGEVLKKIFATLTLLISLYMAFGSEKTPSADRKFLPERVQKSICVIIGAVSSMIGVGGAVLTIPLMSHIGVPMQRASGTGAALGVLIALPGALGYMLTGLHDMQTLPPFSIGYVNLLAVAMIVPASVLLAPMGVEAAHNLSRAMLRRVFAVVLVIVSVRMFMSL